MPLQFTVSPFLQHIRQVTERTRQRIARHVAATAVEVQADIVALTPVDEGIARAGWFMQSHSPLRYEISNNVIYIQVLEYGGYRGVGPKTIQMPEGIFSRSAPHGMVRITLAKHRKPFLDGITRILQGAA